MIIPEGLLIHLSEIRQLIKEIDQAFNKQPKENRKSFKDRILNDPGFVNKHLSSISAAVF